MKLDDVKKLHQKKYRSQFGLFLVEGEHLILELQKALSNRPASRPIPIYFTEEHQQFVSQLSVDFVPELLNKKQMAQISDTKSPQGIIACVSIADFSKQDENASASPRYVYLYEIQDPGNLGTILRSLAWFGDFRLILSANCVDPFNSKVVRSSMGAIFHVNIEQDVGLDELQSRFDRFAYLDMQGSPVHSNEFANFQCYLFGNEARGVPLQALQQCRAQPFTIAGSGKIDSLNLASAVNICLYQLSLN